MDGFQLPAAVVVGVQVEAWDWPAGCHIPSSATGAGAGAERDGAVRRKMERMRDDGRDNMVMFVRVMWCKGCGVM